MNKKRIILIAILIAVLVLLCVMEFIRDNYQLGQWMYEESTQMSVQCIFIVDSLDYLEMQFSDPNNDDVNMNAFSSAISSARSRFGQENIPLLEDVRSEYVDQFENLWNLALRDGAIRQAFTDDREYHEIITLKDALTNMANQLNDFRAHYQQMSFLEKCFTSWSNERDILSEAVKLPQ